MRLTRRSLIVTSAAGLFVPAFADTIDPKSLRAIGSTSAPVTVTEFFSLTCPHCAAFTGETFPGIKSKLIDTGKIRWVFWDFPLDQSALMAAMVARTLPASSYAGFLATLFQNQIQWAYTQGLDPIEGLARQAAAVGVARDRFNAILADSNLQNFVLQERTDAMTQYAVVYTPSFRAEGPKVQRLIEGAIGYDDFAAAIESVS